MKKANESVQSNMNFITSRILQLALHILESHQIIALDVQNVSVYFHPCCLLHQEQHSPSQIFRDITFLSFKPHLKNYMFNF